MELGKFFVLLLLLTARVASADCLNLNSTTFLEQTPWEEVLECVEDNPGSIGAVNNSGYNLLMTAVVSDISPLGLSDLLEMVPEAVFDDLVKRVDRAGRTLGHIAAAEAKDPAVVFVLSANGISLLEGIDKSHSNATAGRTPLHFAAERADGWRFVAALMAAGAFVDVDDEGKTPFDLAIAKEGIEPDALLLADGQWPLIYGELFEPTEPAVGTDCGNFLTSDFFLHAADSKVATCLKDKKQLLALDKDGNSILHLAAAFAEDEWIVDQILAAADDPMLILNKRNSDGKTPVRLAVESGKSAAVLVHLLAWGADPEALYRQEKHTIRKDRGVSALHIAAERKDDLRGEMISVLLAFGADSMRQTPELKNSGSMTGGRTPLHLALLEPDPIVLLMLLEGQYAQESLVGVLVRSMRGKAVKQIEDDAGRTALHTAASRPSDIDTLWFLVTYGFSVDQEDDEGNTPLMFAARNFTDEDSFLFLLDASDEPCGQSKTGTTVEAALRANETLSKVGAEDASGMTLSPMAKLKEKCP